MNTKTLAIILVASSSLALSGCDQVKKLMGGGKPSGQVVATVDGEEITSLELRAEMAGFSTRDPKIMKAAEQRALQSIIMRRLVAEEARKQKLDKSSDYQIQVKRGEEGLLAQMYEKKIAEKLTPPTQREADAFVEAHPDQFANRRVIALDQIIAPAGRVDTSKLEALKTLEDVKRQFQADGVPFQETSGELDTLSAPPGLVTAIAKLPAGEVFVLPQRGAYVFNHVAGEKALPFTGQMASNYAMRFLAQQKEQQEVSKNLAALRKGADAKIVYNANYKPPPPPKPGAPAAAAPAAGAPAPAAAPAAAAPPAK